MNVVTEKRKLMMLYGDSRCSRVVRDAIKRTGSSDIANIQLDSLWLDILSPF